MIFMLHESCIKLRCKRFLLLRGQYFWPRQKTPIRCFHYSKLASRQCSWIHSICMCNQAQKKLQNLDLEAKVRSFQAYFSEHTNSNFVTGNTCECCTCEAVARGTAQNEMPQGAFYRFTLCHRNYT